MAAGPGQPLDGGEDFQVRQRPPVAGTWQTRIRFPPKVWSVRFTIKPILQSMSTRGHRKAGMAGSAARSAKTVKPTRLRIIGGQLRGRSIDYHGADFTRPMKDNVRENVFNILGRAVRGAICYDLFAGTGAMAFETLSRGASRAVMIEQHRQAARFIRRTVESLDLGSRCEVIIGDTFRVAGPLLGPPQDDTPWIVFLCPPYALWHQSLPSLSRIIQTTLDNAPPGSVLVAETEKSFDASQLPGSDWDIRVYGGTQLAFIEPAMQCGLRM